MTYWELTVGTTAQTVEKIGEELTRAGFSDLLVEDQQELEGFLEHNRAYWDYIDESLQEHLHQLSQIKLYVEENDQKSLDKIAALLEALRQTGEYGELPLKKELLPETDWEESWKENYPPQPVGETLTVLPYWLSQEADGRLPVILDPGLTFGTGAHPSTQMVMEAMEKLPLQGARCLDLGSGSGILSITALRLGARTAVGVDIDPKAQDIAAQNAAYNGFSAPKFSALTGNVTADKKLMTRLAGETYDLVLVNIVADVIIGLAPVLPNFLGEKTVLLLSGILDSRLEDVQRALKEAGIRVTAQWGREEWRCLQAERSRL